MTLFPSALAARTARRVARLAFAPWTVPLAIGVLGAIIYGLLLPSLGFYWDDWAKIAVSRLWGLSGYWAYYAGDRPLSAWTHIVFTPLLGVRPIAWQAFQLLLTLISAWGVYWVTRSLWPRAGWQSAAAALLFLVYPVFTAHAISVTFHQQWLQYALFLISLGLTVQAGRTTGARSRLFTGLALLLSAVQLTVTEYFAPLELLRPLVLWLVALQTVEGPAWRRLRAALVRYLPYLAVVVIYGLWREVFMRLPGPDPYQATMLSGLVHAPLKTAVSLAQVALQDSAYSLVSVWAKMAILGKVDSLRFTPFTWVAFAASLAAAGLAFVYLNRVSLPDLSGEPGERSWIGQALVLGAAAFLLGCTPAWITGREILFDAHSDRYALPAIYGASLLWVALISAVGRVRGGRSALLAVLIGLGANQQLRAANDYRWIWDSERSFYWELAWRAPGLQLGTALLTYQEVFPNQGLFSSSAALNLLYPQPTPTTSLGYWWYTLSPRYHAGQFSEPIQLNFQTTFRSLHFEGGSPNTLLVQFDPSYGSCLYVVTQADRNDPNLPLLDREMASLTNLSLIQPQPASGWKPPEAMFGPEPSRTSWCYYFEKADLARQSGDWAQVAALGDQARRKGYSPQQKSAAAQEWRPFIQGYAAVGRWKDAADLTIQLGQKGGAFKSAACEIWQQAAGGKAAGAELDAASRRVSGALGCGAAY